MKPVAVYFAYPYTQDPEKCTKEIKTLVTELITERAGILGVYDVVPIVPHVTFDSLFDYPSGYGHIFMLGWEFYVIDRMCDLICFAPTERVSSGVSWEHEFAKYVDTSELGYALLRAGEPIKACIVNPYIRETPESISASVSLG